MCKSIYRKADMEDKVKQTAQGRQDQFGAHGAFEKEGTEGVGVLQLSTKELDRYFCSLVNAVTTDKDTLVALVNSNATLATSNATLTDTVADLQNQLESIGRVTNPQRDPTRQKRACPNCKKEVFHSANDCYELKKNAHLRHPGWWSRL